MMRITRSQTDRESQGGENQAVSLFSKTNAGTTSKGPKRRRLSAQKSLVLLDPETATEKKFPVSSQSRASQSLSPVLIVDSSMQSPGCLWAQPNESLPFLYEPLDQTTQEIRLITLRPGDKTSTINCKIQHFATNKGSRPSYKALSYTWGSQENRKVISLNNTQFGVGENLWQALYHLRSRDIELCLWIDAICINQEDIPERNQQVSRMGTIYGRAEEVIVWLGPREANSESGMRFLEEAMISKGSGIPNDFFVNRSYRPAIIGIVRLTRREYWKRAWIIQEIFKARKIKIFCGYQTLDWKNFAKFFRKLSSELPTEDNTSRKALKALCHSLPARLTAHKTFGYYDLEGLLSAYRNSLCADSKDNIYSLLGLCGKRFCSPTTNARPIIHEVMWVEVEYSKSAIQLFQTLAWAYYPYSLQSPECYQVRRMQMLQEALRIRSPSPELDKTLEQKTMYCRPCSIADVLFCTPWSRSPNNQRCIIAWTHAVVEVLSEDSRSESILLPRHQITLVNLPNGRVCWESLKDKMFSSENYNKCRYFPSQSRLEKVLTSFTDEDLARIQPYNLKFQKSNERKQSVSPPIPMPNGQEIFEDVTAQFFVASNGSHRGSVARLGFGPPNMKSDDEIFQFRGSDVALVIRDNNLVVGRALLLKGEADKLDSSFDKTRSRYAFPDYPYCFPRDLGMSLNDWQSLTW